MKPSPGAFPLLLFLLLSACSSTPASPAATGTASRVNPGTPSPGDMPCNVFHVPATPEALAAEFAGKAHVSGAETAPVTLIVFSDYQCQDCAIQAVILRELRRRHPDDLRYVFFHAPRRDRDKDVLAIQAVEAADLQGMFWEMHELLFEKLNDWSGLPPEDFPGWATVQAAGLGMDASRFRSDFSGPEVSARADQAVSLAAGLQAFALPILYINSNSPYNGFVDLASLDTVVSLEALAVRQFSACPPWVIDPLKQYIVSLHTAQGDAVAQLLPEKAPLAVNNFVYLAEQGWFDGNTFFKVQPGLMAEAGDPSGTGLGNPGYYFQVEFAEGMRFDRPGMLAMDNRGYGTNGSQFFITLAPASELDGQYTIFGQVLSGMEALFHLTTREPKPGLSLPPGDELISVTVEER